MKEQFTSIQIANSDPTLSVASLVAFFLSTGLFQKAYNPKLNGISEIRANTLKSIICGNRLVSGIIRNEIVASTTDIPINLKPNSRPLDTIHVILPPNLSPSRSGFPPLWRT